MKNRLLSAIGCSAAIAALVIGGFSGTASAQGGGESGDQAAPPGSRGRLEEVVVTARRVEESLQDTPVSVTAFTLDRLRQLGISEAKDIAAYTPNLTILGQASDNDDYSLSLRGAGERETALTIDPTVGVYVDGVYIARNAGMAFDIVDLERIEVLRGPQGTLFGRNTIGGVINIITAKPKGEFAYQVEGGYGTRSYERMRLTLDTPALGDWAAKVSFLHTDREGSLESLYNGGGLGQQKANGFRAALRWEPSAPLLLDYVYTRTDREGNGQTNQLTHVRPIYADPDGEFYGGEYYEQAAAHQDPDRRHKLPVINSDSDEATSEIDSHSLTVEWAVGNRVQIKSISSYREWESGGMPEFPSFPVRNRGDVIDGRNLGSGSAEPVPEGTFVSLFSAVRDRIQRQVTQELQFVGHLFDERLHYNVGLYYFEEEGVVDNPQTFVLPTSFIADAAASGAGFPSQFAPILRGLTTTQGTASATILSRPFAYSMENESYAGYGQFTLSFTPALELTVGMRYTVDERAAVLTNIFGSDTEPSTLDGDEDWSEFTPSVTLDYRWTPSVTTYFEVAKGYRAGGFNVRAVTKSAFDVPFDPEELISYEIGLKSDLLQRSLRLNAAVFHYRYNNRQIAQFESGSGGASSKVVNAGKSVTNGLEVEATYVPSPSWKLMAAYSFLDTEYKEFETGVVDPVTGFPTGENRDIADSAATDLLAPGNSGTVSAVYRFDPWHIGQLSFHADVTYSDGFELHPQFTLFSSIDSYYELNGRVALANIPSGADGNLQVALWGKNTTNEKHRYYGIDFGLLGFVTSNYADLARWGVDIVYEFPR